MTHVPYQGGASVLTALMQGDVQGSFVSGLETASMMQSGKLRYLGIASPRRIATLPDVPAIAEAIPGFECVPK
jgi:tripartite-type tricarboxylate transporter receptor subunit TctC